MSNFHQQNSLLIPVPYLMSTLHINYWWLTLSVCTKTKLEFISKKVKKGPRFLLFNPFYLIIWNIRIENRLIISLVETFLTRSLNIYTTGHIELNLKLRLIKLFSCCIKFWILKKKRRSILRLIFVYHINYRFLWHGVGKR
jgi:hypothetical protein